MKHVKRKGCLAPHPLSLQRNAMLAYVTVELN